MPLLFAIGTFFAAVILFLYRKKANRSPEVPARTSKGLNAEGEPFNREKYLREKEAWLVAHTDPLLGRPVIATTTYIDRMEPSWDSKIIINEYRAPFRYRQDGYITVLTDDLATDESPSQHQKFIFEWMVEQMKEFSAEVKRQIRNYPDDWLSPEERETAFDPAQINRIILRGSCPVVWTIDFDTDIGDGEAYTGIIKGKDQQVESVSVGIH